MRPRSAGRTIADAAHGDANLCGWVVEGDARVKIVLSATRRLRSFCSDQAVWSVPAEFIRGECDFPRYLQIVEMFLA